MRLPLYRDDAVVLRVQKLGESDRIITMLTRRHGRVRAAAKGVRRTTSRFGARLEPFGHVDVQLAGDPGNHARSLHTIRQAESIELYGKQPRPRLSALHGGERDRGDGRAAHPGRARAGAAAVPAHPRRAAGAVGGGARQHAGARRVPAAGDGDGRLGAGAAPSARSAARPGRHAAFAVPAGGAVCPDCRPAGATRPAPSTLELMIALVAGDWGVADASERSHRRECSGLVAAHLQWHLERGLRSLPLVDRTHSDGAS